MARADGYRATVEPRRLGAVALRSLFLVGAMLCFFSGIPFLSLAEIASGLYLFPLIVALLSRVVLGEAVGPARLAAVATGFIGSMLILKPAAADFQAVSLLPVAAAFFYACMVLTTRRLCRGRRNPPRSPSPGPPRPSSRPLIRSSSPCSPAAPNAGCPRSWPSSQIVRNATQPLTSYE